MTNFNLDGARPEKVSISRQTMESIASLLEVELREGEFESNYEYQRTREILEECRKSLSARLSQEVVWHPFPDELPPEDGNYLITAHDCGDTVDNPWPYIDHFDSESGEFNCQDWIRSEGWCVIAWASCPPPYKGETDRSSQTS